MTNCPVNVTPVRKIARCTPEPFKKSVAYSGFMARQIFLAALIAAPAFAGNTEGSPFRFGSDCYGPTLDAVFPAPSPSSTATALSVPTGYVSGVQLSHGPDLSGDSPCHPEPLAVRQLFAWLWDLNLGNETVEQLRAEGVKAWRLQLIATEHGATDSSGAIRLSRLETHGVERSDGIRFAESIDGKGLYGVYRFPLSYADPVGATVTMLCSLACDVTYPLSPTLLLRYEILNVNKQPVTPEWVEMDRAVRATVMSWINGG